MAERRMVSKKIVDSDAFMDMALSTQALYFHLLARADDDGFVGNPRKIMRMIGASDDEYKILIAKRFILVFESGVCVIKHWLIHNLIRGDRYTETTYKQEKSTLALNEFGSYTESGKKIKGREIKKIEKPKWLDNRQKIRKESSLPDSFDYKIRNAFIGKNCPVCKNVMKELPVEELGYGSKSNPKPSIQHNIPISKGGKHEIENISVICHSCNVSMQDKETGELNNKEVVKVWNTIGNQSVTEDRGGKVSKDKDTNTAEQGSALIPLIIEMFITINPACKRMYGNKTQRQAVQDLIDTYGFEEVKNCIQEVLPKTNGKMYFPTITTPVQLRDKWIGLKSAVARYKGNTMEIVR